MLGTVCNKDKTEQRLPNERPPKHILEQEEDKQGAGEGESQGSRVGRLRQIQQTTSNHRISCL